MPMFDYKCIKCKHEFEELVRNIDDDVCCEKCGECGCKRLFSGGSSFRLVGGGWYADGYASKREKSSHE